VALAGAYFLVKGQLSRSMDWADESDSRRCSMRCCNGLLWRVDSSPTKTDGLEGEATAHYIASVEASGYQGIGVSPWLSLGRRA